MVKKPKQLRIKTGLRTASKVQEKQLLANAKWIAENPEALIPKCDSECKKCSFSKTKARIDRAFENRGDEAVLRKLARKGDHLSRAYAAAALSALTDKATYLAVMRAPGGDIAYMYSPKIKRESLVGVQYFKDPRLRLLAYAEFARKRGLILYSTKDAIYCTELGGKTPSKFVEEMLRNNLLFVKREASRYSCKDDIGEKGYLQLDWTSADVKIDICEKCLQGGKNTVSKISERVFVHDLGDLFTARAFVRLKCRSKCEDCVSSKMSEFNSDDMNSYLSGSLSDIELYEKAIEDHIESTEKSDKRVLILGSECFGEDLDSFVNALGTSQLEGQAIKVLIEMLDSPIALPANTTANKFLTQHWNEHGTEVIDKIAGEGMAEKVGGLSEKVTPMMLIERAVQKQKAFKIKDSLPVYEKLGKHAEFIDKIAREYKISGRESALRMTALTGTEDTHFKSIGLALRIALDEKGVDWQYTKEEMDLAKHLASMARTILDVEGEEYHLLLKKILDNAGIHDELVRAK